MNKPLNDLELPDGVTETTAPVADSSQKAEDTGSSARSCPGPGADARRL